MGKQIVDITGSRFGRLLVLGYSGEKDKWGKTLWRCLCDCGKECLKDKSRLGGDCHSCGCLKADRIFEHHWRGHGKISGDYWSQLQRNAKARGIEFDVTIEDAWGIFEAQEGRCALSGLSLSLSQNRKREEQTASLDRIDPARGYIKNNIQWLHKKVNLCKHIQSNQDFLELCKTIVEHSERR